MKALTSECQLGWLCVFLRCCWICQIYSSENTVTCLSDLLCHLLLMEMIWQRCLALPNQCVNRRRRPAHCGSSVPLSADIYKKWPDWRDVCYIAAHADVEGSINRESHKLPCAAGDFCAVEQRVPPQPGWETPDSCWAGNTAPRWSPSAPTLLQSSVFIPSRSYNTGQVKTGSMFLSTRTMVRYSR